MRLDNMAIISRQGYPVFTRLGREETKRLKLYAMTYLGHPNVMVEINDQQFELILRQSLGFWARYFPKEERYAYFYTQPGKTEYSLPNEAAWIRNVVWDPGISRIDDIFSAEAYLFSVPGGSILLTTRGPMKIENYYEQYKSENIKLVTPYGTQKPTIRWNDKKQPVTILKTDKDLLICTPNHPVFCNGRYTIAMDCEINDMLINHLNERVYIRDKQNLSTNGTWSVKTGVGCFYISAKGDEFYLIH